MSTPITPSLRAALDVATRALGEWSPDGPAHAVVFALNDAGHIESPARAVELERLRRERAALNDVVAGGDEERALMRARLAELEPYEALHPQECEQRLHRGWFADAPGLPCPWCEIARLQAGRGEVYQAWRDEVLVGTFGSLDTAASRCEAELRAEYPGAEVEWLPNPDAPGTVDLITHHRGHTSSTPWAVLICEVLPEDAPAAVTP